MKCFKLKIKLLGVQKPPVWRDVLVEAFITFEDLHEIIQIAMGWEFCHLHQFIVGDRRRGTYIGAAGDIGFEDMLEQSEITIDEYLKKANDKFWYEYDFGDGWEHEVTLLEVVEVSEEAPLPSVIKAKGACPPEDCGGPWAYEALKETIKNPKAEDYKEITEWLGEEFDPNYFDVEEANDRLVNEIILPSVYDMIEDREPNDILLNFSRQHTSAWTEEQVKAAKKKFGSIVNLDYPVLKPSMTKEDIQMLAAKVVEEIFQINPKAVHITGEGSFLVIITHLLMEVGIPCIESTFDRNIAMSKKGEKRVQYNFVQFRDYF